MTLRGFYQFGVGPFANLQPVFYSPKLNSLRSALQLARSKLVSDMLNKRGYPLTEAHAALLLRDRLSDTLVSDAREKALEKQLELYKNEVKELTVLAKRAIAQSFHPMIAPLFCANFQLEAHINRLDIIRALSAENERFHLMHALPEIEYLAEYIYTFSTYCLTITEHIDSTNPITEKLTTKLLARSPSGNILLHFFVSRIVANRHDIKRSLVQLTVAHANVDAVVTRFIDGNQLPISAGELIDSLSASAMLDLLQLNVSGVDQEKSYKILTARAKLFLPSQIEGNMMQAVENLVITGSSEVEREGKLPAVLTMVRTTHIGDLYYNAILSHLLQGGLADLHSLTAVIRDFHNAHQKQIAKAKQLPRQAICVEAKDTGIRVGMVLSRRAHTKHARKAPPSSPMRDITAETANSPQRPNKRAKIDAELDAQQASPNIREVIHALVALRATDARVASLSQEEHGKGSSHAPANRVGVYKY